VAGVTGHIGRAQTEQPKIAYIFAGSARSLVCPQVHWSIKQNLLDAMGGQHKVFIRLSLEDNKNTKTGDGVLWDPKYSESDVTASLKVLNPTTIERFSFKNQIAEMEKHYPGEAHGMYRQNDLRRYSMYYHRCRAYQLALDYERKSGQRFDWVVLTRLDAQWLEPSLPITAYDEDRVWITETGYDRFNDQFMLIPRAFSDYLYDLNTKARTEVYCLGGPDVEKWKCDPDALAKKYTPERALLNLKYCCKDNRKGGVDHMGRSERIHYKHLLEGGIPLGIGRFPVLLTRRMEDGDCVSECFRIYAYHYKEYVFRFNSSIYPLLKPPIWPDTRGRSISARDRNLCYSYKEKIHPWKPITAEALHTLPAPSLLSLFDTSNYTLDYSLPLLHPLNSPHPSILLKPKDTELWRIHPTWNVEGCLTLDYTTKESAWSPCKGHSMKKTLRYDGSQLWSLYVLPIRPRALKNGAVTPMSRSYFSPNWFPESTYADADSAYGSVPATTRVWTINAENLNSDYRPRPRCLGADALAPKAKVGLRECSQEPDPLQTFLTVRAEADGSHPQTVVGQLRFAANPDLCVAREDNKKREGQIFPETARLFVFQCAWPSRFHQNMFEFELIMS